MSNEISPAPSIEFLGQKFSYPKTWQGTVSVLIVCITIGFIAWTLEPEQIQSYKGLFVSESSKQVEEELVNLNKQLNAQVTTLKSQLLDLSKKANLEDAEKTELLSIVNEADNRISKSYEDLIEKQKDRQNLIKGVIEASDRNPPASLKIENDRISKQLSEFQIQRNERIDNANK